MSRSKSTQNLKIITAKPNYTTDDQTSPDRARIISENNEASPADNLATQSYPKYTSRYKTFYMKEYKQKKPITNVCYNPNTRTHTKQQYNMDSLTTNNVSQLVVLHDHYQQLPCQSQSREACHHKQHIHWKY